MPPTLSCPPPPLGHDDCVAEILATMLGMRASPRLPRDLPVDAWQAETRRLVTAAGTNHVTDRKAREGRLSQLLAETAPQVGDETFQPFVASRFNVVPVPDFRTLGTEDLYFTKINHGFWEQVYALFGTYDPLRMRIQDPSLFRTRYLESSFLDALTRLIDSVARVDGGCVHFPGVHFGISLGNGSVDHDDLMKRFQRHSRDRKTIVQGAAIGLSATFESIFSGHRPQFHDGSFPKRGLETGMLRETLAWAATDSARILFVVPPHLDGIRLADTHLPQETVLVPATTIHESWVACVHAVTGHVFGHLAADGRILVITQSGVVSAMLGFVLSLMKPRLFPATSRLRFFDLGQVLDVATPDAGGEWTRQGRAKGDLELFAIGRR